MLLKKNTTIYILLSIIITVIACAQTEPGKKNKDKEEDKEYRGAYNSPPGYDLNKPVQLNLKTELDEISGLSYYAKDTSVFSITDEQGLLYKIHLTGNYPIEKWKFSKARDFEDLVLLDSTFYVLSSKGELTALKFLPEQIITQDYKLNIKGKNEFEILYHDNSANKLVAVCKDCETDNKKTVTAFSFDPDTRTFSDTPFYTINAQEIAERLGEDKEKFKPSAACIHPATKELYIISSVNKVLVVTDAAGKIKDVYRLDPKIYKQPEGLTFSPSGDLIISNEAADVGAANVLIFKYRSGTK